MFTNKNNYVLSLYPKCLKIKTVLFNFALNACLCFRQNNKTNKSDVCERAERVEDGLNACPHIHRPLFGRSSCKKEMLTSASRPMNKS